MSTYPPIDEEFRFHVSCELQLVQGKWVMLDFFQFRNGPALLFLFERVLIEMEYLSLISQRIGREELV